MTYAEIISKLTISDSPLTIYMDGLEPFVVQHISQVSKEFVMTGRCYSARVTYKVNINSIYDESCFTE